MKLIKLLFLKGFLLSACLSMQAQQTSLGDTLGAFNAGILTPTPDRSLLGIEFAEGHYWITGSDPGAAYQRKLYKISADGQNLVQYWTYSTISQNWADLAYDGQFLYGAGMDTIHQINMVTGQPTGVKFNGPYYYNTAITYDPASDHFYIGGSGNLIHEVDRTGNTIRTIAFIQDKPVAGLAWDTWTAGGPYLWVWSMKYTSTDVRPKAYQILAANGQLTGVSFEAVQMFPQGTDGALSFTLSDQIITGEVVFAALQASHYQQFHDNLDWVVLYDLDAGSGNIPGPEIVVNPSFIQNDLMHNDSIDVPVYIENFSNQWTLNWQALLEYPDILPGDPGDVLMSFDATAATAPDFTNNMRSLTYLNDHIYILTYPDFSNNTYLYKLTKDGSSVVEKSPVPSGFGNAWTALSADQNYLYAATSYVIVQLDPATLQSLSFTPKTNFFTNTFAYDPQNEVFYMASGGIIRKIDKAGQQLNFYILPFNIAGLSYDSWSPGAPYLWVYHQLPGSEGGIEAIRIEPETGNMTGLTFQGVNFSTDSTATDIAHGIYVTPNWQENRMVMLALHQSALNSGIVNNVVAYDLATIPPPGWIRLLPPSTGITSPLGVDTLYVRLSAIMADTLMVANLVIRSNDVLNPETIIPINFRMLPLTFTGIGNKASQSQGIVELIYPNPATDRVHIQLASGISEGKIEIIDAVGSLVLIEEFKNILQTISIDVSRLKSGLHTVHLITPKGREIQKLIIY